MCCKFIVCIDTEFDNDSTENELAFKHWHVLFFCKDVNIFNLLYFSIATFYQILKDAFRPEISVDVLIPGDTGSKSGLSQKMPENAKRSCSRPWNREMGYESCERDQSPTNYPCPRVGCNRLVISINVVSGRGLVARS